MIKAQTRRLKNSKSWSEAQAAGIDMSLIESNLRKTPAERLRAHHRALAAANALRTAMERRHA